MAAKSQMSASALSQRLNAFRQNFKQILGPKRQGYGELSQLEQPLVSGSDTTENNDEYLRQHGVTRPGATPGAGHTTASQGAVPSQSEELQLLCSLGREAAEILWEMAALQEETNATKEMLEKGELLQAQLRGMIGDYKGGDESVLAAALEVFDLLSNTLAEYQTAMSPKGTDAPATGLGEVGSGTAPSARLQPPAFQQNPFRPAGAAGHGATAPGKKADEEAPLISFD